ncbi:MAG: HEAT repeat domain-containing protein [Planctomycetaceae bacterium]
MDQELTALVRQLLNSKAYLERAQAAESLGRSEDRRVSQYLIAALSDSYATVRAAAARSLAKIGDASAIHALSEALAKIDPPDTSLDGDARAMAAFALGQIGEPAAIPQLVQALRDQEPAVTAAAANALDQMKWKPSTNTEWAGWLLAKDEDVGKACEANPDLLDAVLAAWKNARDPLKLINALKPLRNSSMLSFLMTLLGEWDSTIRMAAIEGLHESLDARVLKPLVGSLINDWDRNVRIAAGRALVGMCRQMPDFHRQLPIDMLISGVSSIGRDGETTAIAYLIELTKDVRAVEPLLSTIERMMQSERLQDAQYVANLLKSLLQDVLPETQFATLTHIAAMKDKSRTTTIFPMYGDIEEPYEVTEDCDFSSLRTVAEQELQRRSHSSE